MKLASANPVSSPSAHLRRIHPSAAVLPAAFSPIVKGGGAAGLSASFAYALLLSAFNVVRFVFSR